MKTWLKYLLVTIVVGVAAFLAGPILWPPGADIAPTPSQVPFFLFLSVLEALLFGLGVAFLLFAFPKKRDTLSILQYLALGWLLVSWWPHDALHANVGVSLPELLYIEYGFHFTLIIAALILVYAFYRGAAAPAAEGRRQV